MTASWGGFGVVWGKNICWIVIRPHRHTYGFVEKAGYFSLSFFNEKYRDALNFCGSNSGKNVDKVKGTGLTPVETGSGNVYFSEARLVIECRKLYFTDIDPSHFIDPAIESNYPAKDYHRMFIGEIVQCLSD
jgi:flavin reductase (DIM6/NTAB) family NADH-FMN oxidoreductase RutF